MTRAINNKIKLNHIVSVADFGAKGDGVTDDTAAFNAALAHVESIGGGTVQVPWPKQQYLITSSLWIPNHCAIEGGGAADPSGSDGSQIKYTGTGAAIWMGADSTSNCRGVSVNNLGVELLAAGSTGFFIQRARDVRLDGCAVDMDADGQVGFWLDGARISTTAVGTSGQSTLTVADASEVLVGQAVFGTGITSGTTVTNVAGLVVTLSSALTSNVSGSVGFGSAGVFDCNFYRLSSYGGTATPNAIHYKLSGSDADGSSGRCNSNQFYGIRGGGGGKGIEIGPSLINSFYGVEFESLSGHYIHCLSGAENNKIFDAYLGDNDYIGTNKLFYCEDGAVGNHLDNYRAGAAGEGALFLGSPGSNIATHILGDRFVGTASSKGYNLRLPAEAFNRIEVRADRISLGDGTAAPIRAFPSDTVEAVDFSTALGTYQPNIIAGRTKAIRFLAGSSGTLTIGDPLSSTVGDRVTMHFFNNSGGALSLLWTSTFFVKNTNFPTTIASNARISLTVQRVFSATQGWIQVGAAHVMS